MKKKYYPDNQEILLDGWPRNLNQTKIMKNDFSVNKILVFNLPVYESMIRLGRRFKEDLALGKGRAEDRTILGRYHRNRDYDKNIEATLSAYSREIIYHINANRSIEEIHQEVLKVLTH